MKLKHAYIVFLALLTVSCVTENSIDEGECIDSKEQKILLTSETHWYEGDLYTYAKELELETLATAINTQEKIVKENPKDTEAKEKLEELKNSKKKAQNDFSIQEKQSKLLLKRPRIPRPPLPCLCKDLFFTFSENISSIQVKITSKEKSLADFESKFSANEQLDIKLSVVKIKNLGFEGEYNIQIQRNYIDGSTEKYNVNRSL